jgi:hypothetical protein
MSYAIKTNNIQLVNSLFQWDKEFVTSDTLIERSWERLCDRWDFFEALRLGREEIATGIMLNTGIDMPVKGECLIRV